MPGKEDFIIQRIRLEKMGWCAHPLVITAARSCELGYPSQDYLHKRFVKDEIWGTEPSEMIQMAEEIFPKSHICAKENWTFDEFKEILNKGRVVVILDITDLLSRYDMVLKKEVDRDQIDGHYVILTGIFDGMAVVIDPSADEIVHEDIDESTNNGVQTTDCENIYRLPLTYLEKMWWDTNRNGTINYHWALVMLHPDDDSSILEKHRNQGKI